MSDLRELYQQVILDHNKNPRNFRELSNATSRVEGYNPLCGDRITLELKVEQSRVSEARFKGDGCAISTAAASLLTELVRGKNLEELTNVPDEQLISALESNIQPARLQCALLPLQALREGLKSWTGLQDSQDLHDESCQS